jgi:hypothetical protein
MSTVGKKKPKILNFLLVVILSGVFGFFIGKFGFQAGKTLPTNVIWIWSISFIPVFFFVIGFHEAGHAVAGISQKFDFKMYVVGPFMWDKEQDGWKFKWNKNVNTSGGMVICLPTQTHNLKKSFSIFAAGGPLASLVLTLISFLVYLLLRPLTVSYFFSFIGFFSLLIFVVTILPFRTGGFTSDGGRILNLLRGGDKSRFELLMLKIITETTGGKRPSLLNLEELTEASSLATKLKAPFGVYIHGYFYQAMWDRGDLVAAEKHLEDYMNEIDQIPPGLNNSVWMEAAFFYANAKNDLEKATFYWNKFKPSSMIPQAQVLATEAMIGKLNGEKEYSLSKSKMAMEQLPNMLDKGLAVVMKERLVQMQSF